MQNVLASLYNHVIVGKQKALIGAVVAFVVTYISQNGLTAKDLLTKHGLWALIAAAAVHLSVYFKANR